VTLPLPTELEEWLSHILAAARAARTRPEAWAAVRATWVPGAPGTGTYSGDAAHPADLREVLLAVQAEYAARLPPSPDEDEAMWEFRHRRLVDFVRDELDRYIEQVAPRPSVGAVFAQAAAQSAQSAAHREPPRSGPAVSVRTCRNCGAPRQMESLYGTCRFCGAPFFPPTS
jgi:hypothetical protein